MFLYFFKAAGPDNAAEIQCTRLDVVDGRNR